VTDAEVIAALRGADLISVELSGCLEDTPQLAAQAERFGELVALATAAFGAPMYRGKGPRWGPIGRRPDVHIAGWDYTHSALEIAWWTFESRVAILMITGHDADTLQCLHCAVATLAASPPR